MKISVTFYVDDELRAALRARRGLSGLATRDECLQAIAGLADADLEVIRAEFQAETAGAR